MAPPLERDALIFAGFPSPCSGTKIWPARCSARFLQRRRSWVSGEARSCGCSGFRFRSSFFLPCSGITRKNGAGRHTRPCLCFGLWALRYGTAGLYSRLTSCCQKRRAPSARAQARVEKPRARFVSARRRRRSAPPASRSEAPSHLARAGVAADARMRAAQPRGAQAQRRRRRQSERLHPSTRARRRLAPRGFHRSSSSSASVLRPE